MNPLLNINPFQEEVAVLDEVRVSELNELVVFNDEVNTFDHVIHRSFADNRFVGEGFSVALFAAVRLGVECVAERSRCHPFHVERDVFRLESSVTAITICRNGKSAFSIVA